MSSSSSVNGLTSVPFVQKINFEALEKTNIIENQWNQFKKEYEELKTNLEEFPKELSASILMPLAPKVFIRAQLCNTNEVFIRHGENIFTKQTAYEAKTVCERQIKRCNDMIAALEKEKSHLSGNLNARQGVIEEMKEIIEPFDEEEEKSWREKHKQKVKEYKQSLVKKQQSEPSNFQNEDDIIARLDRLDCLEEELFEKARNGAYIETSSDDESCDDEDSDDNESDDYVIDDVEDEDDDNKELEIVFTNDAPESIRKKIKKRVSFNNRVEVKEFETSPEEYFIPRKEEINEIDKSETIVSDIDDIVERITNPCLENVNLEKEDEEITTRPISRFMANKMNNKKS